MEETGMSLDTAFLIISAEGALITMLMGALAFLYIADKRSTNRRLDKQDDNISALAKFMREQQKQITDLNNKINNTIEMIGKNQENDSKRMEFMQSIILKMS
jgi:peptidoglycan hydrolase CwlO-like protein